VHLRTAGLGIVEVAPGKKVDPPQAPFGGDGSQLLDVVGMAQHSSRRA
jgi:hypothetical protein